MYGLLSRVFFSQDTVISVLVYFGQSINYCLENSLLVINLFNTNQLKIKQMQTISVVLIPVPSMSVTLNIRKHSRKTSQFQFYDSVEIFVRYTKRSGTKNLKHKPRHPDHMYMHKTKNFTELTDCQHPPHVSPYF